ncbi:MAG: hypothetical protein ABW078_04060 [Sedimenticola sp.]
MRMIFFLVVSLCLGGVGYVSAVIAENYVPYGYKFEPYDYEINIKPRKGDATYLKDPNVWVYTRAFAERFGMPEKWIDGSLRGAEAVAFRIETSNTQTCGYFGEEEHCRSNIYCIFDVYLKDEFGAKLPWESHKTSEWQDWDSSMGFLSAQKEEDHWYWMDEVNNRRYVRLGAVGLRSVVFVEGPPIEKNGRKQVFSGQGPMYVREYRRDFFKGLDLIELRSCMLPNVMKPARIYFLDPQADIDDPQYRFSNGQVNRAKLDADKKYFFEKWDAGDPPHKVILPDAYMDRVSEHDKASRHHRNLVQEMIDRNKTEEITQKVVEFSDPELGNSFVSVVFGTLVGKGSVYWLIGGVFILIVGFFLPLKSGQNKPIIGIGLSVVVVVFPVVLAMSGVLIAHWFFYFTAPVGAIGIAVCMVWFVISAVKLDGASRRM